MFSAVKAEVIDNHGFLVHSSSLAPTLQLIVTPTTPLQTSSTQKYASSVNQPPWLDQKSSLPSRSQPNTARNLYAPYQRFSNSDVINFPNLLIRSDGSAVQTFGSYRQSRSDMQTSKLANRRSDTAEVEIINAPAVELPSNPLITVPKKVVPASAVSNVTRQGRKRDYMYIPLRKDPSYNYLLQLKPKGNSSLHDLRPPPNEVVPTVPEIGDELPMFASKTERNDVVFPSSTVTSTDRYDHGEETSSRQVGFQFPSYILNPSSPFQPQAYREDIPHFGESTGFDDVSLSQVSDKDKRLTRQLVFEPEVSPSSYTYELSGLMSSAIPHTLNSAVAAGKQYRDEVTKFGDVNGPITALPQRLHRNVYFGDSDVRTSSPVRPYTQQKKINDFLSTVDPSSSRKSRYYPFKSSRSPRVVFPTNENVPLTGPSGTGTGVYFNDNVVFRDQNFGVNELAAVQDVRNDFSLQDLDSTSESSSPNVQSANTFKEKGKRALSQYDICIL